MAATEGEGREADILQTSRLMELPAELRNDIWRLVVAEKPVLTAIRPHVRVPGLLRSSRQCRTEALGMWLYGTPFRIKVYNTDEAFVYQAITPVLDAIQKHALHTGATSIGHNAGYPMTTTYRGQESWSNLVRSLKAYHNRPGQGRKNLHWCATPSGPPRLKVIQAAYHMVTMMRKERWRKVDRALAMWHVAVAAGDAAWL
ncbi:hypothetical protein LTR53_014754 [Teratosphaeriaceae sp. CCFEE 6253]|nr:hypothetical protein LTR53_014754 [Teratosphaeriaceae sp. CCFEE 6253]